MSDIALIHLGTAICLLTDGNPVSALHLAGAAEEITGKLVDQKGLKRAIDFVVWGHGLRCKKDGIPIPDNKECIKLLNASKNTIKHNPDGDVDFDFEVEAITMIRRAIINCQLLGLTDNEIIRLWISKDSALHLVFPTPKDTVLSYDVE